MISEHEPRKGTETPIDRIKLPPLVEFQNMNPERGRKLYDMVDMFWLMVTFQNMNPERGRKQIL